jgi:hypothetical protein
MKVGDPHVAYFGSYSIDIIPPGHLLMVNHKRTTLGTAKKVPNGWEVRSHIGDIWPNPRGGKTHVQITSLRKSRKLLWQIIKYHRRQKNGKEQNK